MKDNELKALIAKAIANVFREVGENPSYKGMYYYSALEHAAEDLARKASEDEAND